jgi:hypothetical protein
VRCYAAYHANCTPPGSLFLLRPFFLCPKHPQPKPTSAVEHAYNDKRQKELMNTFRRIPPISVFSGEFTGTWVTTSSYLAKRPFQLSRVLAQAGREVMNSQPPPYVSLVRNTYLIRPYVDREQAESVCSCTPASKCDQRYVFLTVFCSVF